MLRVSPLVLFIFAALIISCADRSSVDSRNKKQVLNIAGSTSVMPFTEKLAEYFMLGNANVIVNVQAGGSTAGIQACMNKTVGIGMSSRERKPEEKSLHEIIICFDGIAIAVHPTNPLRDLKINQVKDIFSGKIRNWRELGWIDRKIDAVTREEGSGTRGAFEELVMKKEEIDEGTMVQDSNGSVKEVVATDPYAIGYLSMGMVDRRVKTVAVDSVTPTVENVKLKKYKIVRPFLYLTRGEPNTNSKPFIDYVLSREGQNIL
ncbi:MAG: phosphate ABC transporter substrate-binding protein, partial [Deltaproteobacteria bacterium]|nr:phosphate ABC transporter substrate-binding protein [Deltaproteobacteria bacterium]